MSAQLGKPKDYREAQPLITRFHVNTAKPVKKLKVILSKQTGYKYLKADEVKKTVDGLIDRITALEKKRKSGWDEFTPEQHMDILIQDVVELKNRLSNLEKSIKTKALEDLNNRVFALERKTKDIKWLFRAVELIDIRLDSVEKRLGEHDYFHSKHNHLTCDYEVQGQPRPSDGNCNKCGYEMMATKQEKSRKKKVNKV